MVTILFILALGLLLTATIFIPILLFRQNKRGCKVLKSRYYNFKCSYLKKAPHELRSDLIYWEEGDVVIEEFGKWDNWNDKWVHKEVTFKGFLENSIVIRDGSSLKEITPGSVVFYRNQSAIGRQSNLENIKLQSRLKSSGYRQLVEQMQASNRAFEQELKKLTA